jgi:hypothetical protein
MREEEAISLLRESFRFICLWLEDQKRFTDFERITIHGALPERVYPYGYKYPLLSRSWLEDGVPDLLAKHGGMVEGKWFSNRVLQEWWAVNVRDPVIKTMRS